MKKLINLLSIVLILAVPSVNAYAQVERPDSYDYYISDEEFEKLEHVDAIDNGITLYTDGLIEKKTLSLAKDGNNLIIKALTKGITDVKKSGFTYIKLQQYKNGEWVDYKTFKDLYKDSSSCSIVKSVTADKGYKYRVTAQHYAKKSLLSIEKIKNTTPALSF